LFKKGGVASAVTQHIANFLVPQEHILASEPFDETITRKNYSVSGAEHTVGVAHTINRTKARERVELHYDAVKQQIIGSELISPVEVVTPGNIPAGGFVNLVPANPLYVDGCRINNLLKDYDQFKFAELSYEYEPACSTLTNGAGQIEYVTDPTDLIPETTGFAALRNGFDRAGSKEFSWFASSECSLHFPQQDWYYTGRPDPWLTLPGELLIQTMLAINATAATVPLGFLVMHFAIDVRSPDLPNVIPQAFFTSFQSLDFSTLAVLTPGMVISALPGALGLTGTRAQVGAVMWGTVAVVNTTGAAGWNVWQPGQVDTVGASSFITIAPGIELFWRNIYIANGTVTTFFFPSLEDALAANDVTDGARFMLGSTPVAAFAGRIVFVQDVQGTEANGQD
jgi:hypothetical protein